MKTTSSIESLIIGVALALMSSVAIAQSVTTTEGPKQYGATDTSACVVASASERILCRYSLFSGAMGDGDGNDDWQFTSPITGADGLGRDPSCREPSFTQVPAGWPVYFDSGNTVRPINFINCPAGSEFRYTINNLTDFTCVVTATASGPGS